MPTAETSQSSGVRWGSNVRWGVGVLTAPRPGEKTIIRTLHSLIAAGWPAEELLTCIDIHRSGCYRGWKAMASAVLAHAVGADWLLLVEDDCLLSAGLRAWLEFSPPDPAAWNSLYCAGGLHSDSDVGWRPVHVPRQCWGSVAYMVTPALLASFLREPPHPTWRDGTDLAVGQFCRRRGVRYTVHSPSFADHIGDVSSLDQPGGVDENRRCKAWVAEIELSQPEPVYVWNFRVRQQGRQSVQQVIHV